MSLPHGQIERTPVYLPQMRPQVAKAYIKPPRTLPELQTAEMGHAKTCPRQWFIYGLTDPVTDELRYIGWTFNIEQRIDNHCRECRTRNKTRKTRWLSSLIKLSMRPNYVIFESGTDPNGWSSAEIAWIWLYRSAGARLTNMTDGGQGSPMPLSAEHKAKLSAAKLGKKFSAEHIQHLKDSHVGREDRRQHIRNISAKSVAFTRGKPLSEDHKQKIRNAKKGICTVTMTPERKAQYRALFDKVRNRQSGPLSPEIIEKIKQTKRTRRIA